MKLREKVLPLTALIMILYGCHFFSTKGNIIISLFDKTVKISGISISKNDKLLIIGERYGKAYWQEDGTAYRIDTSFLFVTNKKGKILKQQKLRTGANHLIVNVGDAIFLLSQYSNKSVIYSFEPDNGELKLILTSKLFLKNILKVSKDSFVCEGRDILSDDYYVFDITKKGEKLLSSKMSNQIFCYNNRIFKVVNNINSRKVYSELVEIKGKDTESVMHRFDYGVQPKIVRISDNNVFALYQNSNNVMFSKASMGNNNQVIKSFNSVNRYFPKYLFVFNKKILILLGEREASAVKNHFFYSGDNGENWEEVELSNPYYSGPITFLNSQKKNIVQCLISIGEGKLQELIF